MAIGGMKRLKKIVNRFAIRKCLNNKNIDEVLYEGGYQQGCNRFGNGLISDLFKINEMFLDIVYLSENNMSCGVINYVDYKKHLDEFKELHDDNFYVFKNITSNLDEIVEDEFKMIIDGSDGCIETLNQIDMKNFKTPNIIGFQSPQYVISATDGNNKTSYTEVKFEEIEEIGFENILKEGSSFNKSCGYEEVNIFKDYYKDYYQVKYPETESKTFKTYDEFLNNFLMSGEFEHEAYDENPHLIKAIFTDNVVAEAIEIFIGYDLSSGEIYNDIELMEKKIKLGLSAAQLSILGSGWKLTEGTFRAVKALIVSKGLKSINKNVIAQIIYEETLKTDGEAAATVAKEGYLKTADTLTEPQIIHSAIELGFAAGKQITSSMITDYFKQDTEFKTDNLDEIDKATGIKYKKIDKFKSDIQHTNNHQ